MALLPDNITSAPIMSYLHCIQEKTIAVTINTFMLPIAVIFSKTVLKEKRHIGYTKETLHVVSITEFN